MKTRLFTTAALIITITSLCVVNSVQAQQCQTRCPNPVTDPYPMPQPTGYFLGVYTSTVPVDIYGGSGEEQPVAASSDNRAFVVPGYGDAVYGQRINKIVPNSPAFHAGLEPGDIIVDANGLPMDSKEDLVAAVQASAGYLEMKVLDGRSGNLVWVVAETDPQDPNPVFTTTRQPSGSQPAFRTQVQSPNQPRRKTNNGGNLNRQLNDQIRSAIETFGGRRPPVRRNR